jgi:hypothetical protein
MLSFFGSLVILFSVVEGTQGRDFYLRGVEMTEFLSNLVGGTFSKSVYKNYVSFEHVRCTYFFNNKEKVKINNI